jgi:tRNA threonylcarbamoyladenosine biosynthesis protein TsaB
MIILTIRTDKPLAQLCLFQDMMDLKHLEWEAHRQLAATIHKKIDELLESAAVQLKDINGIVVFKGPGSFTGLRIGISVSNALAYGLDIPIVSKKGEDWIEKGIEAVMAGHNEKIAMPEYGSEPNITKPRK